MATKPTNIQIYTATKDGFNANVKELVEEALKTNDLSVLSDIEVNDMVNVFLNLTNKYAKQVAFDVLSGWSHELVSIFLRDAAEMGEYTELIYLNNDPSQGFSNYNFGSNSIGKIFKDYKPELYSDTIRIQKQVNWTSTLSFDEMKRAMLNKYGIYDTLIGLIMASLETKANLYAYNYVKAILSTIIKSYVFKDVNIGDTDNAIFNTEVAITLGKKMRIPSTLYNDRGIIGVTKKPCLVLTPNTSSNFDVNVMAFAFNERYTDLKNTYRIVEDADVETYTLYDSQIVEGQEVVTKTVVDGNTQGGEKLKGLCGYIFDEDKIRMELTIKDTLPAPIDPYERRQNFVHHVWLKAGLNKGLAGIRLTTVVEKPTIVLKGNKVTITSEVLNAQDIYYTTDGSTPTSASTKYTGEITLAGTETAIKAIAVSVEASKNSDVASLTLPEVETVSVGE